MILKKIIYIIILPTLILLSSCAKESDFIKDLKNKKNTVTPPGPEADFYTTNTSIYIGQLIMFYDQSENDPTEWEWDFGDGSTSTEQSPTHTYSSTGSYSVKLTVSNGIMSDSKTKTDYITVSTPPLTSGTYTIKLYSGSYPSEVSWYIRDNNNNTVASGDDYSTTHYNYTQSVYLSSGYYTLYCNDSYGDGWNGAHISIYKNGAYAVNEFTISGSSGTQSFTIQ